MAKVMDWPLVYKLIQEEWVYPRGESVIHINKSWFIAMYPFTNGNTYYTLWHICNPGNILKQKLEPFEHRDILKDLDYVGRRSSIISDYICPTCETVPHDEIMCVYRLLDLGV